MFRELLGLFGPQDNYKEIHELFMSAFRTAAEVFKAAHVALWAGDTSEETAKSIYARDVQVNKRERSLRKRVVRHLSVQQGLDIIFSLRLMSLIKDVERIGDYGKNLLEVGGLRRGEFEASTTRDALREYGNEVCAFLDEALKIFDAGNEKRAGEAVVRGRALLDRGEEFVREAAALEGSTNAAVCFALMARHYKRSAGHATNVLTGLVMPIHKLDYFDEDRA